MSKSVITALSCIHSPRRAEYVYVVVIASLFIVCEQIIARCADTAAFGTFVATLHPMMTNNAILASALLELMMGDPGLFRS